MTQRLKEQFKGSINPGAGSEQINKMDKPLIRFIKKKRERTQMKSEIKEEKLQLIPQKYKEL